MPIDFEIDQQANRRQSRLAADIKIMEDLEENTMKLIQDNPRDKFVRKFQERRRKVKTQTLTWAQLSFPNDEA